MARISLLNPIDQARGDQRLLDSLIACLSDESLARFRIVAAFARQGPFRTLEPFFRKWTEQGKIIEAIFGIDHLGTSIQAIQLSQELFTRTFICRPRVSLRSTFHPKVYLFDGNGQFVAFIGSNNMTTGGLETNFEACIRLDGSELLDAELFVQTDKLWKDVLQYSIEITDEIMRALLEQSLLLDEGRESAKLGGRNLKDQGADNLELEVNEKITHDFDAISGGPVFHIKPPRSLEDKKKPSQRSIGKASGDALHTYTPAQRSEVFIIEIKWRANREVHLSMVAVKENPIFFGWPFTGLTTPKKQGKNKPYPQREPDPLVDFQMVGASGVLERIQEHGLNMVYYERNSEIRITFPSKLKTEIPVEAPYAILEMRKMTERLDYEFRIILPDAIEYQFYLQKLSQTLPSGGKPNPRRYGWL